MSVNKMGVPNVAMIFGPTLMSNENVNTQSFFYITVSVYTMYELLRARVCSKLETDLKCLVVFQRCSVRH